jgi:protein-disulfide isomerase
MRNWLLFLIISCFSFDGLAQKLKTDTGKKINFSRLADTTLVVFYDLECPICEKYTKNLRDFTKDSAFKNIKIMAVLVNKKTDYQAVMTYKKDFLIETTFAFDPKKALAKKLKAIATPEAFLMNRSGEILYSGAIDNWFYDLGKSRSQPTELFLKNAIKEIQQNKKPSKPHTKAIGCAI